MRGTRSRRALPAAATSRRDGWRVISEAAATTPLLSVVLKQEKNGKKHSANKQAAEEPNYGYPPTVLSHCCFAFAKEPF